jgi:Protein of unknown function (DUF2490)
LKKISIITIAIFTGVVLKAQTSNHTIIWTTIQVPVQLSAKWQVVNDASYRTLGFSTSSFQYTFRTGVRYFVNKKFSVGTGAASFNTRTSFQKENHEFGREFRLWQEAAYEMHLSKKMVLQNRFRTEERFFSSITARPAFNALRVRYRPAIVHTINEHWKILCANEYMHQLANHKFKFQQNRVNIAGIYVIDPSAQIQAGYIWSKLTGANQHFITFTFQKTILANGNNKGNKK